MFNFFKITVPLATLLWLGAGCLNSEPVPNQPVTPARPIITTTTVSAPPEYLPASVRLVDQVEQYALEFPEKLYVQRTAEGTSLVHAVPFTHEEPCNQKETVTIPLLTDYQMNLNTLPKNKLADWLTQKHGPEYAKEHLNKDWFKIDGESIKEVVIGGRKGVKFELGVEGCGRVTYVMPLTDTSLLIVEQPYGNITSQLFGGEQTQAARALPGIILAEDVTAITERILASLTTVQTTGSLVGFIRPPSSTEMIAYSSENNFSFRYDARWLAQVTPRPYGIDYNLVPDLVSGLIPRAQFEASNRLTIKSAASVFINAETEGFTVANEAVPVINKNTWHTAEYIRLPGGPTTERRVIAIGPHSVREDLGFLVQLNYPVDKEKAGRAIFDRVLNTLGPRP